MARLAVALVWLYQGLWCKLLQGCPGHRAILAAVPGLAGPRATAALLGFGAVETGLAVWVLSGWRPRAAATAQTLLLAAMNGGGLLWGREHIADPGAMLVQNFAFLTLAWIAARRGPAETAGPGPAEAAGPGQAEATEPGPVGAVGQGPMKSLNEAR